MKRQKHK